tara:strand:+ start:147 stop:728 length:582 start_codon:yes stop_codon:yes gene_type:complete
MTKEQVELYGGDVVFVGTWEVEREECIRLLAENGIKVRVWGGGWQNMSNPPKGVTLEHRPLFAEEYVRVINASKINLGFLRKMNRDLQTTRSIEIPACSSFMLAERTSEHLYLFEEGKEAEYFDSMQELIRKTRYFLENETERLEIARAGRRRCINSLYSNEDRLRDIIHCAVGPALKADLENILYLTIKTAI